MEGLVGKCFAKVIGSAQNQFLQTAFNQDEYELSKWWFPRTHVE